MAPPAPRPPRHRAAFALALLFAGLWILAYPYYGGRTPLHANTVDGLVRFAPNEAPFFLAAAVVEGALVAWLVLASRGRWPSWLDAAWRALLSRPGRTHLVLAGFAAVFTGLAVVRLRRSLI